MEYLELKPTKTDLSLLLKFNVERLVKCSQ